MSVINVSVRISRVSNDNYVALTRFLSLRWHLRGFLEIALSNIHHKQTTRATPRAFVFRSGNYLSDNSFPGSTRITS
jgi:hypothetical protein